MFKQARIPRLTNHEKIYVCDAHFSAYMPNWLTAVDGPSDNCIIMNHFISFHSLGLPSIYLDDNSNQLRFPWRYCAELLCFHPDLAMGRNKNVINCFEQFHGLIETGQHLCFFFCYTTRTTISENGKPADSRAVNRALEARKRSFRAEKCLLNSLWKWVLSSVVRLPVLLLLAQLL